MKKQRHERNKRRHVRQEEKIKEFYQEILHNDAAIELISNYFILRHMLTWGQPAVSSKLILQSLYDNTMQPFINSIQDEYPNNGLIRLIDEELLASVEDKDNWVIALITADYRQSGHRWWRRSIVEDIQFRLDKIAKQTAVPPNWGWLPTNYFRSILASKLIQQFTHSLQDAEKKLVSMPRLRSPVFSWHGILGLIIVLIFSWVSMPLIKKGDFSLELMFLSIIMFTIGYHTFYRYLVDNTMRSPLDYTEIPVEFRKNLKARIAAAQINILTSLNQKQLRIKARAAKARRSKN